MINREPLGTYGQDVAKNYAVPGQLVDQAESFVFRVESEPGKPPEVWKLYPHLSLATIQRYKDLTELVGHSVNGQGGSIKTLDGSAIFNFQWKINPIKEVRLHNNLPLAVSDWVEGDHLQALIHQQESAGRLDHPLQQVSAVDKGRITDVLDELSKAINVFLRIRGDRAPLVWITPLNVKPTDSQLIVTDLCASVSVVGG